MRQPGMRITVDAAMRARDVSRPRDGDDGPASGPGTRRDPANGAAGGGGAAKAAEAPRRAKPGTKAAKNERRRLGKRGAARKPPPADGH